MSNPITALNANTPATSSSSSEPATVPAGGQTLTQADFLKIMVAQFTQQDPLSSGDSGGGSNSTSDYVNQLMAMTNLTTMQNMSGELAQSTASSLPGQTVDVDDNGNHIDGVVTNARVNGADGAVYFTVGGVEYPSSDLYSISQTPAAATTPPTTPTP